MIKKRIKKISELVFLITIRQIWKLLCNLYHMIEQPFLTFKKLIVKDRDKSQMFLVGIVFLMPILAYSVARVVWDYYRFGLIINGVGMFFLIVSGIEFFLLAYLGYWIIRVMRSK
ncbi:MAG: hypothetical protein PHP97_04410 [Candidatus Shapirobacteria bacterium]|nr:hypothetical protein [Candidatus Shapirobacteria bacterium]MDD4383018.1 hypothetical protein [Candidatus Shapirobacteria bacterium]